MPKMRTIKEAVDCIQKSDPESAFREYALRKTGKAGIVPHIMAGNRALVDVNSLYKILCTGIVTAASPQEQPLTPDRARILNSRTLPGDLRFTEPS